MVKWGIRRFSSSFIHCCKLKNRLRRKMYSNGQKSWHESSFKFNITDLGSGVWKNQVLIWIPNILGNIDKPKEMGKLDFYRENKKNRWYCLFSRYMFKKTCYRLMANIWSNVGYATLQRIFFQGKPIINVLEKENHSLWYKILSF